MKKLTLTLAAVFFIILSVFSQTTIKMEKKGGVYVVPCKVNGLDLKFIFDTGAGDVSISLTEALFMIKNGYLSENDIIGTEYYRIANGEINEGTKILIKEIQFAGLYLYNVEASIVHNLDAPLLLGQSAISKLGEFQFDSNGGTLTILNAPNNSVNSNLSTTDTPSASLNNTSNKSFVITQYKTKLMRTPKDILEIEANEIYVPYGQKLKVIGVENGFYKVEYINIIGYLNSIVAK